MNTNLVFDLTCAGGGADICRVPYRGVGLKNPADNVYEHQIRGYLEDIFQAIGLPYALATMLRPKDAMASFNWGIGMPDKVSRDWAKQLASDKVGFDRKDVRDWDVVISVPRQGKTILVLVPRGYAEVALKQLGVLFRMKGADQGLKVAKYLARLFASYKRHAWGELLDLHGDLLKVRIREEVYTFRVLGDTPFLAGSSQLSPRACNGIFGNYGQYRDGEGNLVGGRAWRAGDAGRLTVTCEAFLNKSQFLTRNFGPGIDGVLPDNKLIIGTDKVFFGLMDELHVGPGRTNIQDAINFRQYLHFERLAGVAYQKLYAEMQDQALMLKNFLSMEEQDGADPMKMWLYAYAVQKGVIVDPFFGLAMRPFKQREKQILNPTKARIEIPDCVSAYYFHDHHVIDWRTGQYNPKLARLAGRCVANPKLVPGKLTAIVRSPTGSPREWFLALAAGIPADIAYEYSDCLFEISHDCALEMYYAGGGADNDDLGRGIQDEEMVATFVGGLMEYPPKKPMVIA